MRHWVKLLFRHVSISPWALKHGAIRMNIRIDISTRKLEIAGNSTVEVSRPTKGIESSGTCEKELALGSQWHRLLGQRADSHKSPRGTSKQQTIHACNSYCAEAARESAKIKDKKGPSSPRPRIRIVRSIFCCPRTSNLVIIVLTKLLQL